MRLLVVTAGLLAASLVSLSAQVNVEVILDQEQFLRDESLPVKVRVINRSGQTLKLGTEPDWLTFTLQKQDGFAISKISDPPVGGEFDLESAMVATRAVDLMPHFEISEPGRYYVIATIKLKQWQLEESSKPKVFEIVRGTKLWEQEFGVPNPGNPPELRKYALQQANYRKRLMLYVRVTDPLEHQVFRVLPAGPLVSFSHPEAQVDKNSDLHLLFQMGARTFKYLMVSPDGSILMRHFYEIIGSRPVLRSSEAGRIVVNGGSRRFTSEDLPPPESLTTTTNEVRTPEP